MKLVTLLFAMTLSNQVFATEPLPPLEVVELEQNLYLHVSYQRVAEYGLISSNGLIVIDGSNAYIVDTPWSVADTEALANWTSEHGYQLAASISTHSHTDRTAGIGWLNQQSIPTYASAQTNALLTARGEETATQVLEQETDSLIPSTVIETFYPGGGHTSDNMVVWLPRSSTLFGGCLVRSMEAKTLGYTGEAVLHEWANSVTKLSNQFSSAKRVVPGHGKPGGHNLLKHTIKLADSAYNLPH